MSVYAYVSPVFKKVFFSLYFDPIDNRDAQFKVVHGRSFRFVSYRQILILAFLKRHYSILNNKQLSETLWLLFGIDWPQNIIYLSHYVSSSYQTSG